LKTGIKVLRAECIDGLEVDEKRVKELLDNSFAYATAFNPYLGYSNVSKLVMEAYSKGIPLRQLIQDKGIMKESEIEQIIAQSAGPCEVDRKLKDDKN